MNGRGTEFEAITGATIQNCLAHICEESISSVAEDGVNVAKIGVYLDSRGGTRTRVAARNVPLDDVSG